MSGPFDLGPGRNGPHAILGQQPPNRLRSGTPYKLEHADVDYTALGDVVVCALAAARETVETNGVTLHVPEAESPYHVVLAVGPKVPEELGYELHRGDVVVVEGGRRIETPAGSVWFVRAKSVLCGVQPAAKEAAA